MVDTKQGELIPHDGEERLPGTIADSASILAVIIRAASDPNTDVDKLERLMAMYERLEGQKAKRAFDNAMAQAQEDMGPVRADANNPQTKSKYATYGALDKKIRPIYTKNGFSLSFDTGDGAPADFVRVLCYVGHSAGHSRTYKIDMPADGKGAKGGDVMTKTHATGSAISYGQRYLLKAIFNIVVGDDDDGNKAAKDGKVISAEQVKTLLGMIEETKSDIEKFCRYFKIESVPDLQASEYQRAVDSLKAKGNTK